MVKTLKTIEPISNSKECPKLLKQTKANLLKQNKIDMYLAPARAEALYVALGTICTFQKNSTKWTNKIKREIKV